MWAQFHFTTNKFFVYCDLSLLEYSLLDVPHSRISPPGDCTQLRHLNTRSHESKLVKKTVKSRKKVEYCFGKNPLTLVIVGKGVEIFADTGMSFTVLSFWNFLSLVLLK